MAKTFIDVTGQTIEIIDGETEIDTNEDIISEKISDYFVIVSDNKYKVDKKIYDAVKKYLK